MTFHISLNVLVAYGKPRPLLYLILSDHRADQTSQSCEFSFSICSTYHLNTCTIHLSHNGILPHPVSSPIFNSSTFHPSHCSVLHLPLPLSQPRTCDRHRGATTITTGQHSPQLLCQNHTGRNRFPLMAWRQMGHPVLPPSRFHSGLYYRARSVCEIEARV